MVQIFQKIFDLLDRRERLHLGLLCLAVLLMAVLELVGIAAIVPFLSHFLSAFVNHYSL